jgi:hypothetical protein
LRSADAAGKLLVNNGAIAVGGGTPTVANTSLIQVFGAGGSDGISLNKANGALPRAGGRRSSGAGPGASVAGVDAPGMVSGPRDRLMRRARPVRSGTPG